MKIQYDPDFIKKLKKVNVRIKRKFQRALVIFQKNPFDPQLNNHKLHEPYLGLRSIDITADYRAIYEQIQEGEEEIAYFVTLRTEHIKSYTLQRKIRTYCNKTEPTNLSE